MHKLSTISQNLKGSEIIGISNRINQFTKEGKKIYNYTIGDFNPKIYPIPSLLKEEIIKAYQNDYTNYPNSNGVLELRNEVLKKIKINQNLDYSLDEILIAAGARPIIYALYQAIVDNNENVIVPFPSWNNNHYCTLSQANIAPIYVNIEDNFIPTHNHINKLLQDNIIVNIKNITLLTLCSPLNPTGTMISKENLEKICVCVVTENERRKNINLKPLYVLYDQIYSDLIFDGIHYDPVSLVPEMKPYTIYIDGISKSCAATGVRVGWAFGPTEVISKMKDILNHMGAWAPHAEQIATAEFFKKNGLSNFLPQFKIKLNHTLNTFYKGFLNLKLAGYNFDVIKPQGAIYLSVKIDLKGQKINNKMLVTDEDVCEFLLNDLNLGLVPFTAFGYKSSPWYRLSIGTANIEDIEQLFINIKTILNNGNQN